MPRYCVRGSNGFPDTGTAEAAASTGQPGATSKLGAGAGGTLARRARDTARRKEATHCIPLLCKHHRPRTQGKVTSLGPVWQSANGVRTSTTVPGARGNVTSLGPVWQQLPTVGEPLLIFPLLEPKRLPGAGRRAHFSSLPAAASPLLDQKRLPGAGRRAHFSTLPAASSLYVALSTFNVPTVRQERSSN